MIPNATKFLWGDLYADVNARRFKSPRELAATFERAGVAKGQTVVTYCAVGMRASLAYFAARVAGIPARVYTKPAGTTDSGDTVHLRPRRFACA
jgi:3-mercaptopyruvate sulfurtransferase SseA